MDLLYFNLPPGSNQLRLVVSEALIFSLNSSPRNIRHSFWRNLCLTDGFGALGQYSTQQVKPNHKPHETLRCGRRNLNLLLTQSVLKLLSPGSCWSDTSQSAKALFKPTASQLGPKLYVFILIFYGNVQKKRMTYVLKWNMLYCWIVLISPDLFFYFILFLSSLIWLNNSPPPICTRGRKRFYEPCDAPYEN